MDILSRRMIAAATLLEKSTQLTDEHTVFARDVAETLRDLAATWHTDSLLSEGQLVVASTALEGVHDAIQRSDLREVYSHSLALVGSLPGESHTLPDPPWKG